MPTGHTQPHETCGVNGNAREYDEIILLDFGDEYIFLKSRLDLVKMCNQLWTLPGIIESLIIQ